MICPDLVFGQTNAALFPLFGEHVFHAELYINYVLDLCVSFCALFHFFASISIHFFLECVIRKVFNTYKVK